jgi:predicted ester cyclase
MQATPSLVRRIFDQAFNQGDLTSVDELVSADIATHLAGWGLPANRLGLKQVIANLRAAFPDLHCTIEGEIRDGDQLAAHWTMRGTNTGSFFGNQPTGRLVTVQGLIFARTAHGRIVENWILIDQMSMLQQLGVVPPPRGGS